MENQTLGEQFAGKTSPVESISIDYPEESEIVDHPTYTYRIRAPKTADLVEIRLDQGQWQPCRRAVGYWWFDWSGYGPGRYQAEVRSRTPSGAETSKFRSFTVDFAQQ